MRTTKKQKDNQQKAVLLFAKGLNQKQVAEQIGVTEKTIGKWVKTFNLKDIDKQILLGLKERLQTMIADHTTKPTDIKTIVSTIKEIEHTSIKK